MQFKGQLQTKYKPLQPILQDYYFSVYKNKHLFSDGEQIHKVFLTTIALTILPNHQHYLFAHRSQAEEAAARRGLPGCLRRDSAY